MARQSLTATASSDDASVVELIAAPGAGSFINITALSFSNDNTTTSDFVDVLFGEDVAFQRIPVPAGLGSGFPTFDSPVRLPENTALNFQAITGTDAIYANVVYYIYPKMV